MIGKRKASVLREMSSLNLTPLTDVMLALLILFLVMEVSGSSAVHRVALPGLGPEKAPSDPTVYLKLMAEGKVGVKAGKDEAAILDESALKAYLAALRKQRLYSRILISSDPRMSYMDVVKLMDAARGAGYEKISLDSSGNGRSNP